jgi:hypothetical protein
MANGMKINEVALLWIIGNCLSVRDEPSSPKMVGGIYNIFFQCDKKREVR